MGNAVGSRYRTYFIDALVDPVTTDSKEEAVVQRTTAIRWLSLYKVTLWFAET
jgi:hypothetical protein